MTSFLRYVPPMGIYETLYAFLGAFGTYMGERGTHPWSQGFPRTVPLPDGPHLPSTVRVTADHRKYPKAWGLPALREAIAAYYRASYGVEVSADNVMVFAGGRPAIVALLLFLEPDIEVRVASTEYTPYYDILERLRRSYHLVHSGAGNRFRPPVDAYTAPGDGRTLMLISNPCNPTGVTRTGDELRVLVEASRNDGMGLLIDEAYELLHDEPVSALAHVDHIEDGNLFVVGAATKGLQAPGIRIGWVVSAKRHIDVLGNFSSFGMGGVSHPSQCYAVELLHPIRVPRVRRAVPAFYASQRARYGEAFEELGLELFSGDGGFYHWCRLPDGLTAQQLNEHLFKRGAAILKGTDCDMARLGDASPLASFFRFSFGPLAPESFEADIDLLGDALREMRS
ncbi:pyridoxal phosphate-dependent aminotransferase [Candidatus Palauibacter sp.]|uniref:pyridoxal phosphate-dependent aminotransferase n=1 Tax=Candidatus Palauibacter sp. TaxID=3101350 RepID=UPI003AF267E2